MTSFNIKGMQINMRLRQLEMTLQKILEDN